MPLTPTPLTIPDAEPTVAIVVLPLVHVPPPASVSAVVEPEHTVMAPVIGDVAVLTVNVAKAWQPVDS